MLKKILCFASIVEAGTGLGLMIDPRLVVSLLMGPNTPAAEIPLARLLGVAIFALALACWPSGSHAESRSPAFRGMLVYNVLIASLLAYQSKVGQMGGVLLWPAVVLHAVVAMLLIWTWRAERRIVLPA